MNEVSLYMAHKMALNLIYGIVGIVIALTAFATLIPFFTNATSTVAASGVAGASLFSGLLPFILVVFVFIGVIVVLVKVAKGGGK